MKRVKKLFRLIGLVGLIILALCGIGLNGAGPLFSQSRERYTTENVKIELVQTKDEEGDSAESNEIKG